MDQIDEQYWLTDTWRMIKECAEAGNPKGRVALTPEGCAALLKEKVNAGVRGSLEEKLAAMVWYLIEVRSAARCSDPKAFESYLDDPEVANWLEAMSRANRIKNTRFISS